LDFLYLALEYIKKKKVLNDWIRKHCGEQKEYNEILD